MRMRRLPWQVLPDSSRKLLRQEAATPRGYRYHSLLLNQKRYFFASFCYPVDHGKRLQDAKVQVFEGVERIADITSGKQISDAEAEAFRPLRQYVLLDPETSVEDARRVRQLQLARLCVQKDTVLGATVIHNKMGTVPDVCGRLLETALETEIERDESDAGIVRAVTTLHGLRDYAVERVGKELSQMDKTDIEAIVQDFVNSGVGEEAALYSKFGGNVDQILYGQDR